MALISPCVLEVLKLNCDGTPADPPNNYIALEGDIISFSVTRNVTDGDTQKQTNAKGRSCGVKELPDTFDGEDFELELCEQCFYLDELLFGYGILTDGGTEAVGAGMPTITDCNDDLDFCGVAFRVWLEDWKCKTRNPAGRFMVFQWNKATDFVLGDVDFGEEFASNTINGSFEGNTNYPGAAVSDPFAAAGAVPSDFDPAGIATHTSGIRFWTDDDPPAVTGCEFQSLAV